MYIYIYGFSIKGWHQVYKMVLSCLVLCVEEGSLLSKCSTNLKPWSTKKRPEGRLKHWALWSAAAKSLPSCPTLCDPIDGSPSGSPVPGSLQARTLERVAISFSNAGQWKVKSESEVAQSCPTLSDPMDHSLPGFSVQGIFQARVLEWGAIAFSGSVVY